MLYYTKLLLLIVLIVISGVQAIGQSMQELSAEQKKGYVLGPGDLIQIKVHGEQDLTVEVRIEEDGYVSYPFLGDIKVSGRSVDQLQHTIHRQLRGDYLVDPDVRVFVLEYRPIYVNGEVRKPGGYQYVPGLTVQKAVALAGGFTPLASKRSMTVVREGASNRHREDVTLDSTLGPGDTLIVGEGLF